MQRPLPAATIDAIVEGRHADPFAVLGLHEADGARRRARVRSRAPSRSMS